MKKRLLAMMLVLAAVMMTACGGKTYEKGQYTAPDMKVNS